MFELDRLARGIGQPLVDRMADHGSEFAHQTIGDLARDWKPALRSNLRIAAWVSALTVPVGFNWP